jgi:hypothetical protein
VGELPPAQRETEGKKMITAIYTIKNEWNADEIFSKKQDFATISELENFLAYNRSYILTLEFTGRMEAN